MKNGRSRPRTALALLLSAGLFFVFAEVAGAAEEASSPKTQVQKLIADLGSKDFETARRAAVALGNSGDTSAVPALIRAAVGDVLPELVAGRSREQKIPDFDDRAYAKAAAEAAAGARGKVDPKDFTTTRTLEIKGAVNLFQTPLFREAAVRALGKLRSAEALAPLTELYLKDEEPMVLVAAGEAIVRIDQDAGYELVSKDLGGNDAARIRSAISGLALVENREVMSKLVSLLYDEATRVDVLNAMRKRPYQETRAHVLKMLSDGDVSVVLDALEILRAQAKAGKVPARRDDPELGETLATLAGETRHQSWKMAMAVMSEIGLHEDLREILCTCLESRDELEQLEALSLLLAAIEKKLIDGAYLDDRMIDRLRDLGKDVQSKNGRKAFQLLRLAGRSVQ